MTATDTRARPTQDRPIQARRTQAERRAESDRRLVEAAAELIVERGIEGTSLAEIGRRAGYSHALVNHRFGSKDALVERVNQAAVDLFTDEMRLAIHARTGLDAVCAIAETYLDLVRGESAIGRVHLVVWSESLAHASSHRPDRVASDRHFRSAIGGLLRQGIVEGTVSDDVSVDATSVVVVGLLRGVAMQTMLDPAASVPSVREHLTRMLSP